MKANEMVIKFFSDKDLKSLEEKVNFYLVCGIDREYKDDCLSDDVEYVNLKFTQTDREYSAVLVLRSPPYK